jgi:hypothetical protein
MSNATHAARPMVTFYPTVVADHVLPGLPAGPLMLSAASQATRGRPRGVIKMPNVPPQVTEIAVDPGGWVAASHGGYKFSWQAYRTWLCRLGPRLTWAAFPDLPCEKGLASDEYAVRERQEQTLQWASEFWISPTCGKRDGFLGQPWAWVPTVQGRDVGEYVWMAEQMQEQIERQRFHYDTMASVLAAVADKLEPEARADTWLTQAWAAKCAAQRRIGIGSLCQRPAIEVAPIVRAVSDALPGQRFHLWGIDIRALRRLQVAGLLDVVASFDSASYNGRFGRDIPKIDAERKRMRLTQAGHAVEVLLPRRQRRIAQLLEAAAAQQRLF